MASTILIKRSTTAGSVPTTADLSQGELAVNVADKKLYTNNGTAIIEIGTVASTLDVEGALGVDGDLDVNTNKFTVASATGNTTVAGTLAVQGDADFNGNFDIAGQLILQTEGTASNHVVTKAYVDQAVTDLIGTAGTALDTLGELADAINDDANFAATVTTALGTKLNLSGGTMTGNIVMGANKVTSTATPTSADDLTRKGYIDSLYGDTASAAASAAAAASSASDALASEGNAATSASNASTSATDAAASATAASTSESNAADSETAASGYAASASNSATAAATSATQAATSAANAESAYDSFDDRYLGAKASDPTLDNDGDALIEGALYFNTTNNRMFVYTGSTWSAVSDVEALYNSGNLKLATTATGVDVTGTVSADGLTVDGNAPTITLHSTDTAQTAGETLGRLDFESSDASSNADGVRASIQATTENTIGATSLDFFTKDSADTSLLKHMTIDRYGDIHFYEDTGTTPKLTWDASAESLGIGNSGTDISGTGLDDVVVGGGSTGHGVVIDSGASSDGAYAFASAGAKRGRVRYDNNTDSMHFETNNTGDKVTIDSSGNVGIDTASPSTQLNVGHASHGVGMAYADATLPSLAGIYTSSDASHGQAYGSLVVQARGDYAGYGITFRSSNQERARIDSSGNLLVGGTSVGSPSGTASFRSKLQVGLTEGTPSSTNYNSAQVYNRGDSGVYSYVSNVTYNNHMLFLWRGSTAGSITSPNGTTVIYGTSSDYRLKENVVAMNNASERVMALNPVRFTWIHNKDVEVDGFLAHEAQEVVPEAVTGTKDAMRTEEYEVTPAVEATYDEDGNELTPAVEAVMGTREVPDYQGIDQSKLVPLLTKALQEALTEIDNLKQRVDALENK